MFLVSYSESTSGVSGRLLRDEAYFGVPMITPFGVLSQSTCGVSSFLLPDEACLGVPVITPFGVLPQSTCDVSRVLLRDDLTSEYLWCFSVSDSKMSFTSEYLCYF